LLLATPRGAIPLPRFRVRTELSTQNNSLAFGSNMKSTDSLEKVAKIEAANTASLQFGFKTTRVHPIVRRTAIVS
jgi:hypothetical protein